MASENKRSMPNLSQLAATAGVPEWMRKMREAAQNCINESDIEQIVQGQVKRAKDGDASAIKFVFEQVLGGAAFKGATIIQNNTTNQYATDPEKPTPAKHGTEDRIAAMAARVSKGLPLNGDGDETIAENPDLLPGRGRK